MHEAASLRQQLIEVVRSSCRLPLRGDRLGPRGAHGDAAIVDERDTGGQDRQVWIAIELGDLFLEPIWCRQIVRVLAGDELAARDRQARV